MEILKIIVNNFKLCEDNLEISFVPIANKTEEDKEFELNKIDEGLYKYSTLAFVGKNASGKTTIMELFSLVYNIFSKFKVSSNLSAFKYWDKTVSLDVTFYYNGNLYRYTTELYKNINYIEETLITFKNQKLYKRKYTKSIRKDIFNYDKYDDITIEAIAEDISILSILFGKIETRGIYLPSSDLTYVNYGPSYNIYKLFGNNAKIKTSILKIFDEHISNIDMIDEDKFIVTYTNKEKTELSNKELYEVLSSGTSKGFNLFTYVVYSLLTGTDLVIDELENHFHKTLVEYIISLYKDKSVNKKGASLVFTTHYCELLDLFNRCDNLYITKYDKKIYLENIYKEYKIRPDLLKSKKYYDNFFNTGINYESLMDLKKELM